MYGSHCATIIPAVVALVTVFRGPRIFISIVLPGITLYSRYAFKTKFLQSIGSGFCLHNRSRNLVLDYYYLVLPTATVYHD